jgi:hypothetical protein
VNGQSTCDIGRGARFTLPRSIGSPEEIAGNEHLPPQRRRPVRPPIAQRGNAMGCMFLIQNCDMQRVGLTSQRLRDNGTRSKYANGSRDYMRATIVKTSAIIRKQHRF